MSQTIEDTSTTESWTADYRIGGVWKDSRPVEFAAPISAVPVRNSAQTEFITQGFVGNDKVELCTSAMTEAEKIHIAALGNICRECR